MQIYMLFDSASYLRRLEILHRFSTASKEIRKIVIAKMCVSQVSLVAWARAVSRFTVELIKLLFTERN